MTAAAATDLDCRRCGACCKNLPANMAEGFLSWVEIEDDDVLLQRSDLVRRLVVLDGGGVPHLRLYPDGRCRALRGAVGVHVRCTIYENRPRPCHEVEAGGELCLMYRAAHGLTSAME
jgi:Fe-S-cluster containining protein